MLRLTTLFSNFKQNSNIVLLCDKGRVTRRIVICIDLLIDGGTSDEKLNIYELKAWEYLLENIIALI